MTFALESDRIFAPATRFLPPAAREFAHPSTTQENRAALAARTGINRSTVRAALRELRGKLGLDQGADLVMAARAGGLLAADAAGEHDEREG